MSMRIPGVHHSCSYRALPVGSQLAATDNLASILSTSSESYFSGNPARISYFLPLFDRNAPNMHLFGRNLHIDLTAFA